MDFATIYEAPAGSYDGDQWACGLPTYNALYAGYLLGTDYWDGTGFTPVEDISGNGRDLTITGSVGSKALAAPSNYATCPFNGDDVVSANGECTLIAVAHTPDGQVGTPIGNRITGSSGVEWMRLYQYSGTFAAEASMRKDGTERQSRSLQTSSVRTGYSFMAGTFTTAAAQLMWTYPGSNGLIVRPAGSGSALSSIGGPLNMMIGNDHSSGGGASNVAAALIYDRVLTAGEISEVLAGVTALLASGGTTVGQ